MNLFERLKNIFYKNKIKQLPQPIINNTEDKKGNTFVNELKIENDPFSKLLSPDTMKRIDIDEELKPIFKDVIIKIRNYFIKNDLISTKDYDDFFEKFLLDKKLKIRFGKENELPNHSGGIYIKDENAILMEPNTQKNKVFALDLCHEFLHFLVMADSNKLNWSPSQILFINEGYTEYLASQIYDMCPQSYIKNVNMIKFLNSFSTIKNAPIKAFLKDEFIFGDENMWANINRNSINGYSTDRNNYRNIQREIIQNLIDKNNIKSVDQYIHTINILKSRPSYDKEYMKEYLEDLNKIFLENMQLPLNEKNVGLLNNYCDAAYKSENFGNGEVVEFDIDDINGAFDANGTCYGDFPNGQVTSMKKIYIEIKHNDKTYNYSLDGFNGTNWVEEFEKAKTAFLNYKEKDDIGR